MADLVAGGAGFVGSHLCQRLIDAGRTVICVDNFSTGRRANVEHLLSSPRFALLELDLIAGAPAVEAERIYHLASPASPPGYTRFPIETLRVNSDGTRHLLELAARTDSRILYASTSEVYGDPLEHPQREEYRGNVSSTGPRSMYDEAKRFGEALTMAYRRSHSVDVRIARIFNTYGPHSDADDGRLVPNFIVQALTGRPITVYGDGKQTRSLCFVSDLVDGLSGISGRPSRRCPCRRGRRSHRPRQSAPRRAGEHPPSPVLKTRDVHRRRHSGLFGHP